MPEDAADSKPARKRSIRRKTSKKKAPAKKRAAARKDPDAEPAVEAVADSAVDESQTEAPVKKPRRRGKRGGARRKKAAATKAQDEAASTEEAEASVAEAPVEEAAPSPARRKTRRRSVPDLKARARERAEAESTQRESGVDEDDVVAPVNDMPPEPPAALTEHWDEIFGSSTFADLGLRNTILRAIKAQGFVSPTKVQAALIPLALTGKDILGQSRTGTGKTAAFGLPVLNGAIRGLAFQGLILAPTRELAIQIADELRMFARFTPLSIATVYGGQSIDQQARRLSRSPEIIVATPGRLMDMLERGHLHLDNVRFAVLDEVDRMLDIGFRDDIRAILSRIRSEHQTVFVSATISPEIEKLARTFMHADAERIETTAGSLTATLVDQSYVSVQPWDKSKMLAYWVREEAPELALVFCRMKRTVDKLAGRLLDRNINAAAIHGDLPQGKRNRIMDDLRAGNLHILIASDLAARGLDVDGITHVVNFDLPEDPEVYIHRIGRTARAGRGGKALSFVTPDQGPLLTEIEKLANIHIDEQIYPNFEPNPVPEDVRDQRQADERRLEEKRKRTRAAAPELPAVAVADESKFPGGVVPTKMPPRRLGGRVERGR